jgi:hypothetical protein
MKCLQRPSWSSPKGPPAKFNNDVIVTEVMDDVAPDKTRRSWQRTHDLTLDSGPDESSTTSKQKGQVSKSRRQQARDFEVPSYTTFLLYSHLYNCISLEASVGRVGREFHKAST